MAAIDGQTEELPWFLRTSYPVLFSSHEALFKSHAEYDSFLVNELRGLHRVMSLESLEDSMDGATLTAEEKELILKEKKNDDEKFFNLMLTENSDVAFRSTNSPVVDLFYELEEVVSGPRLQELLEAAWAEQPLVTLKIIFNARSIHLGKSSKHVFYRAAGWLAENHPLTLVGNLRWLTRPVIEKKVRKEGEKDPDEGFVKVEKRDGIEDAVDRFDVQYGVSHGYWKDLLNLLALAAEKKLKVLENPRDVLNVENEVIKTRVMRRRQQKQDPAGAERSGRTAKRIAKEKKRKAEKKAAEIEHALEEKTVHIGNPILAKHAARDAKHEALMNLFEANAFYRTLHITVARLFAEQLHADLEALRSSDSKAKKGISLCAKWAPSHGNFHDRHTCIISSIAEILYPRESLGSAVSATTSRQVYLRHAREQYRKDVSALRKHLEVVERDISAKAFEKIKYDRVPSIAMKNYMNLFAKKDLDNFRRYIDQVAEGKARISGAVLMPSTLVKMASGLEIYADRDLDELTAAELMDHTIKEIEAKAVDGQWKALVQRIKDSGTLSSCIAVCDVSGSMSYPVFKDKTRPLDSAVGLSLLIAEVTEPPFGGKFITFHSHPEMISVDTTMTLSEKVDEMENSAWGMNTDFAAVFEKLILPVAIENNLKQEDMVKRVFVFSDMQFDEAEKSMENRWSSSSYERIKRKYEEHGYEMPELVFWNIAGGRAGYSSDEDEKDDEGEKGDETAPKPVLAEEPGTALVSGYSQGMLKVFMDNGMFDGEEGEDEDEEEEEEEEGENKDGEDKEESPVKTLKKKKKKEKKINPLMTVKKAISHKGYTMLEVLD
ncbi:hypothetical protein M441DRAFT_59375 [Trichoderma asperellum CBS 433.97]|uniref:DUF2828 domain-containing protein n=1 Tax=Trichoderma asperellum (strain ATCC 204424 / CBS 433.97 / NBRC 101777) TaxID=1042311 RepID=A0A2T3Z3B8_TRIA4|nr:hypothetical protein M441DRAFT_59375 [Trichoderma asperellum CBS 433.97]PTB39318.1 hypothetical protein M441DRAFT_59375 [Trichoderma asperellum CBS 433.97]